MLTKIKADNMEQQIDPMTGMPMAAPQQQYTMNTPIPSNEMGTANPVFNQEAMGNAKNMFGDPAQRQASLGSNAPLFKIDPDYNGEPGIQKEDFEQFKK